MTVLGARLAAIRTEPRRRWVTLAVAVVVGLAAAQAHWLGFVLGGALVGLASKTLPRALLAGVAFGVLGWIGFAALLAANGTFDAYLGTGPLLYVSAATPIVGGALGSLVRGIA